MVCMCGMCGWSGEESKVIMRRYLVITKINQQMQELHDVSWAQLQELIGIFHLAGVRWEVKQEGEE